MNDQRIGRVAFFPVYTGVIPSVSGHLSCLHSFFPCMRGYPYGKEGTDRHRFHFPRVCGGYPAWASATLRIIVFPRVCGGYPGGDAYDCFKCFVPRVYGGYPCSAELKAILNSVPVHTGVILFDRIGEQTCEDFPLMRELSNGCNSIQHSS